MTLSRGRLEIVFDTVEQLAESMLLLARVLESEGEEFAVAYEPLALMNIDDASDADLLG